MAEKYVYAAVIKSHALTESKNAHTPEIALRVRTTKCLTTNELMEKDFTCDLWLTEKTAERTAKTIREIGFQGNSYEELNGTDALVGVEVEVTTQFEEYNGNQYERVAWVNPKGSFSSRGYRKVDEKNASQIKNKYDAFLKTTKKVAPPSKVTVEEAEKAEVKNAFASFGAEPVESEFDDRMPF